MIVLRCNIRSGWRQGQDFVKRLWRRSGFALCQAAFQKGRQSHPLRLPPIMGEEVLLEFVAAAAQFRTGRFRKLFQHAFQTDTIILSLEIICLRTENLISPGEPA